MATQELVDAVINRVLAYYEGRIQIVMIERGLEWDQAADVVMAEIEAGV